MIRITKLNDVARIWSGDPYDPADMQKGRGFPRKRYFPRDGKMPNHKRLPVWAKKGDIVISRIGGRVFRYEGEGQKLPRNSIFIQVKPSYRDKFDQNALGYYIEQNVGNYEFLPLQGSLQQAIRVNDLRALPITGNTEPKEQKEWADGIDALGNVVKAQKRLAEKYSMMREGVKRKRIDFRELDWYEMQDNRELVRRMLVYKNLEPNQYVDRWLRSAWGYTENVGKVLDDFNENEIAGFLTEGAETVQYQIAKETKNLVPLGFTNTDNNLEYSLYEMGRDNDSKPFYLYEVNDRSIRNLDEMRETSDVVIEVDDEQLRESMTDYFSPIQNTYFRQIENMDYPPAIYRNGYSHQYAIELKKSNPQLEFRTAVVYEYDEIDNSEIEKVEYVWLRDPITNQIFSANGNYKNEKEFKSSIGFSKRAFIQTVGDGWLNDRILGNKLKPFITDDWYSMPEDSEEIQEIDDPIVMGGLEDFDEFIGWGVDETDYDDEYGQSPLLDERIVALCCGQPTGTCSCPKRAYPFTKYKSNMSRKPLSESMNRSYNAKLNEADVRKVQMRYFDNVQNLGKTNQTFRQFDGNRFVIDDKYRNVESARQAAQRWRNDVSFNARVVRNANGSATVYVAPSKYRINRPFKPSNIGYYGSTRLNSKRRTTKSKRRGY